MEYIPDPVTAWQTINVETGEQSNTDFKLEKQSLGGARVVLTGEEMP
ncbi:hypothetical protein SDC9_116315 [bioreactor metagenome]|uniref:Uncharacterized protein n=1 Tax=bioreactor metagenome TaxID=1076179 RepID=A0A645BV96_9ZZZZ